MDKALSEETLKILESQKRSFEAMTERMNEVVKKIDLTRFNEAFLNAFKNVDFVKAK